MLVATLAMVCPFEPPEKQALLEAADTEERTQALLALLRMGAHATDAARPAGSSAEARHERSRRSTSGCSRSWSAR